MNVDGTRGRGEENNLCCIEEPPAPILHQTRGRHRVIEGDDCEDDQTQAATASAAAADCDDSTSIVYL